MKYIILLSPKISFSSIITLNVVVQNIKKMNEVCPSIILIHFSKNIDDLFYFDEKEFENIVNFQNIKDAISFIIEINKDDIKKTVIDISEAFLKIINFSVEKTNRIVFWISKFFKKKLQKIKRKIKSQQIKIN